MPQKFALFLLFTVNLCFAQLSVRNNAYVFVNDQIVFVTDDVNLNEAASTIYLRNEGQLIQGSGTTGNSGVGELSVYQNGNVGEYEYNYWCSPIGSKTSNTINNPFGITFLNDITGLTTSTPTGTTSVTSLNGTSSPLNIEPYWIWKFIASDEYSEWTHVQNAANLNPGEGFTMKGTAGSSDNQNYDFRGKPNKGTISVTVALNQFSLVGNPYPSAMDAVAYIHDTDNVSAITGTLHYWEQDPTVNSHKIRDYDGGYATYTISANGLIETYTPATFSTYNGDGTINGAGSGSPSGKRPRRYIPVGQGFMVEGIASSTVKAKNSHRVYEKETAVDSEFFKTGNTKEKANSIKSNSEFSTVPNDYKRFRINIDFNNTYTRQLVETFHATATNGFDRGLESNISPVDILASDAYWPCNDSSYLAEALPYEETLKIPLTIKAAQNIPVRIRITDIQNFDNSQSIYIHDINSDTYTDLRAHDFDINLNTGVYNNRFEITFSKNALDVEDNTFENLKIFQNNRLAELKISNPKNLNISNISLFDISGKQILNSKKISSKRSYSYSTKSLSDGVYIARISLTNKRAFSKKVIISNKK